jgi:adenine-specific DNA methylase
VPDEPLPPIGTLGFRVQRYGMLQWGDLFTARQKVAFVFLSRLVSSADIPESLRTLLSMVCTKLSDRCNSLVNWSLGVECPNQLFKGNAIPIGWDFAESNLISDSSASLSQSIENIAKNVEAAHIPGGEPSSPGHADACSHPLPDGTAELWFTDPPYYDAVPYSDLSDFFLVWFKRSLRANPLLRDPYDLNNPLSPKNQEIVQDETKRVNDRPKGQGVF